MESLEKFFKRKKVLVTGHTGFKGGWLSQILILWNTKVTGISLKPDTEPNLFTVLKLKQKLRHYEADIREFDVIRKIIAKEKPEVVIHLAAQSLVRPSYDDPPYTHNVNIIGTVNVLEAIRKCRSVKAGLMITTDKVYENKEDDIYYKEEDKLGGYDPYSASKAGAEIIVSSYIRSFFNPEKGGGTLIASARSGNVIGGGDWAKDRIIPDFIRSVFEEKKQMVLRNPNSIRPWQYVLDPLLGYLLLVKKLFEGKKEFSGPWNFGPKKGDYYSAEELIKTSISVIKNGSYKISSIPEKTKHEAGILKLDSKKAKRLLYWRPATGIREALKNALVWYREFYRGSDIEEFTNKQIETFFKKTKK